jgi:hypothetical protein
MRQDQTATTTAPAVRRGRAARSAARSASTSASALEAGHSHAAPVDYDGRTDGWDVVVQLHESFLARQYDLFFAAQALLSAFEDDDDAVDFSFTFESWLFLFLRCDLRIMVVEDPPTVVVTGGELDEVGLRLRVQATTFSRLHPDDPWDQTDTFWATVTRWGALTKSSSVDVEGTAFTRTWAADLAGGRSEIDIDGGSDEARSAILGPAVSAWFADELPLLPATPPFTRKQPWVTWPRSAAFAGGVAPDRGAVSLCFHEDAATRRTTQPFRSYILDHGRNLAVGISVAALQTALDDELSLPRVEDGVTIESVTLSGHRGYLEATTSARWLGMGLTHTARITLALDGDGSITAEVDRSRLALPPIAWLAAALTSFFVGLGPLLTVAVLNVVGNTVTRDVIGGLLDIGGLASSVSSVSSGDGVEVRPERLGVGAEGVFIKGNVEIDGSRVL